MFKRIILSILEHIFYIGILIGSILIIFGNQITAHIARSTTQHTVVKKISQDDLKKENEKADYDWSNVSNSNVLDSLSAKMQSQSSPIAILTQPEAKVATTVVAGLDKYQLNLSAGTISADQKLGEGNYVLVGHHVPKSEWALFSGIYYFGKPGQKIYLTDLNKVYEYTVTNVKFVEETDTDIVRQSKVDSEDNGHTPGVPMLTLISCDITGDKRITEYADLTATYDFNKNKLPKEAVDGFEKAGDFDWRS